MEEMPVIAFKCENCNDGYYIARYLNGSKDFFLDIKRNCPICNKEMKKIIIKEDIMDNWIPVSQALPEEGEWVQVMTQDGTVYPANYKAQSKVWSPVFRGGEVAQLYHGNVKYWQPHAAGYQMVECPDCGRQYLKTPNAETCPICTAFKGALNEEPPTEEIEKPVRRGGRQKKEKEEE